MAKAGSVEIELKLNTKSFEAQIAETEKELKELVDIYESTANESPYKGQEEDLKGLQVQIEKTKNKLIELKEKQDNLNNDGVSSIKENISGIGNSMSSIITKVAKWGLALFGIRFLPYRLQLKSTYNIQYSKIKKGN